MILLDWMGNTLRNLPNPLVKNIVLKLKRGDYEKFRETHILQDIFRPNFQTRFIEDLSINYLSRKNWLEEYIFKKRRRNRENRSKRALRRTESSRNLTTWRIVERPQPPRIFPSLHFQPTSVAWIQPIRGTISWEGEGIIEWSRSKVP